MTDKTQPLFDAWETDDPRTYSIDKIYTEAIDKRHNMGESMRVKVRSDQVEQIAKIVAKDWVPEYATSQDFIRDAIYHRMVYWSEKISDGELRRIVTVERQRIAFERNEKQVAEGFAMCDSAERALKVAASVRDLTMLEDNLTELAEAIENARTPYLERLQLLYTDYGKKYQGLVEERRKANGDN